MQPANDFDSWASVYQSCRGLVPEAMAIWEQTLVRCGNLSPGASILDVGCGDGRFSTLLARLDMSVTGLDLSPNMLRISPATVVLTTISPGCWRIVSQCP